jgi:hypothetical protein
MAFLKKHYEKILLGVMLVGLIGVLVFMIFYIAADRNNMEQESVSLINPHVKELTNLDMTVEDGATARLKGRYGLDLETTNKLLNPMEWQRDPGGTLIPGKKTGPQMVVVTNMTPLYTIISLESATTNVDGIGRYVIKTEKQAAPTQAKRAPSRHYISPGDKPNEVFGLVSVKGPVENPDALVLKLADTSEEVTITKEKPYRRVDGYSVDFRYDPERKVFRGRRVGDKVAFGGVDYVVVEINEHELILMDQSNQKKTSLPFVP